MGTIHIILAILQDVGLNKGTFSFSFLLLIVLLFLPVGCCCSLILEGLIGMREKRYANKKRVAAFF